MLTPILQVPRPPWTRIGKKLESMCRKALHEFDLLKDCRSLAIALSGGKDSLALLFLMKAILGKGFPNISLKAIHISGEFSCGASLQKGLIQSFCDQLDIPLTICHSTQKKESLACYRCSRERRRLIFDAAKKMGAGNVDAVEHDPDCKVNFYENLELNGIKEDIQLHNGDVLQWNQLNYDVYRRENHINSSNRIKGVAI